MRVLYVTSGFPYPLTSGYLRHFHLTDALSRADHDVTLASLVGPSTTADDVATMASRVERVITARRPDSRARRSVGRAAELAGIRPADDVRALVRRIRRLAGHTFDVVLLSGKRATPVLDAIGTTPVVVDLCDATSQRLEGMAHAGSGIARKRILLELGFVRRAERRLIGRAASLLVASERDREAMAANGVAAERLIVLPNGVDASFWERRSDLLGSDLVVMTGVMDYEPNVDAAITLIESVMPMVRKAIPSVRLEIVGRDPSPQLRASADQAPATTVTGFVDDVRPHLEAASVFAAPLRFGAGIQNKLLEAMAMSVPSVTSTLAAAGLAIDGSMPPVTVADEPRAFADALIGRLQAARWDPRPDRSARAYVVDHFSWQRSGSRLVEIIEREGSPT
jgi:hypothetical protein